VNLRYATCDGGLFAGVVSNWEQLSTWRTAIISVQVHIVALALYASEPESQSDIEIQNHPR
jgi:hypothetical protein